MCVAGICYTSLEDKNYNSINRNKKWIDTAVKEKEH